MTRAILVLVLVLRAGPAAATADPAAQARASGEAAALYQHALARIATNTIESRRDALRALERATLLDPGNASYHLTLARTDYACGFLRAAREQFEQAAAIQPKDPAEHVGLGLVWRRDWLKYLDRASLDRAVREFTAATILDPGDTDAWLDAVPLLLEQGQTDVARAAAFRAARSDPGRLEGHLAVAYTLYRSGVLPEADSIFRATIPRLRKPVRERYEDISPVATEADTATLHHLPVSEQPAFLARFWRENDPDPTTPQNEAQLEYWSRVTQAYFLFYDGRRDEWDERGEVYVRYGPPAQMDYNPVGHDLSWSFGTGSPYPANLMVWNYPELGMTVSLQDRLLSGFYLLPISRDEDMDPLPDPDSLARMGDVLTTRGGRGVFHLLPPGARPLPVRGLVARFEGSAGPRLLGQLEVPGGPDDSLHVDWVVLDSARTERARASGTLAPSACAATSLRVADFAAELPGGAYLVNAAVHGSDGREGILRRAVRLDAPDPGLALSDVVVACGTPVAGAGPAVRIEPNPAAEVSGTEPLTAYFEIYHLQVGPEGLARFQYVYSVRSTARDDRFWLQKLLAPRPSPAISVSREEENLGPLRRQFLSVPIGALPPGPYRLEITVRDLEAGTEVDRQVAFRKTG